MPGKFDAYLPYIRQRWLQEQQDWQRRRALGWAGARRAADVLRSQFGAQRVIAFGSLVRSGHYDERSDIDLAVTGLAARDYFKAWAAAAAVVGDFELDVVELEMCRQALLDEILRDGVEL